ncbi:NADH-ubiquinone oxidoreductase-F iron-sulfur binding region domain-containing protein [Nonomuraea roseoviolacea]|uniref:NADH:ubiquinone oxidoreductase subunit F (NADH-binding)/ferredoxin n=1 Tax=Nonomuraea roseoviolacea subsp. carminata TaxID=160689 RepID=A0ABT1JW37_9ACTN|nr:NADH-quinone oxidoreductase subunit NuoF family protein [Nonomuraea roseoviolacea]MCP2345790.1 NADH:ubiquinone oxidoreductase subunit F (NADH-binding)/ferredoxin [Nonomuraea roseoviolacea subsp. carminata]
MIPHRAPDVLRLGPARLTAGLDHTRRLDLPAHRTLHGEPSPRDVETLIAEVNEVDMRGRGGAAFPFGRKLRAVADAAGSRECVVLVNGAEGEPASSKDAMLLIRAPHLVLDGAVLAAEALNAREVVVATARGEVAESSIAAAVAERRAAKVAGAAESHIPIRVVGLEERFISGEGGALVRAVNGLEGIPPGRKKRAATSGVDGLPTLLSNTETFAQLAILAELGPEKYAEVGTSREPGTVLLTVSGGAATNAVIEAQTGTLLADVLDLCDAEPGEGVLMGGYHGAFLTPQAAVSAVISREGMKQAGADLGAGIIVPLGEATCPLGEAARVTAYLAAQSAGQCGPCRLGLPDVARQLLALVDGTGSTDAVRRSVRAVERRGACFHPDGTAKFVLSALDAFESDIALHLEFGSCGRPVLGVLPLPEQEVEPEYRLDVDWTRCEGHGLCAHLLPEFVALDEYGFPSFKTVPGWMAKEARRAVDMCPALALRLAESSMARTG